MVRVVYGLVSLGCEVFVLICSVFLIFCLDVGFFPAQPDISLVRYGQVSGGLVFFAPHGTEYVVNEYVADIVKERGGLFCVLKQEGRRNIRLNVGHEVVVDPNRIFTSAGVRSSLLRLNPGLEKDEVIFRAAEARAILLGQWILGQFDILSEHLIIVAIHNNTDGYDDDARGGEGTVSILRYQKKLEKGSKFVARVFLAEGDEDDLFYLTQPQHFELAKRDGWNAILQSKQVAILPDEDDGSLSVWAEMAGIPYVNIEAERVSETGKGRDHLEVQRKMVDYVYDVFR